MIKLYIAILLIAFAPICCCAAEGADSPEDETPFAQLPKKTRVKLDRLLELDEHAYVDGKSAYDRDKEHQKFMELLVLEIGNQIDDEVAGEISKLEGRNIKNNIVAMAVDIKENFKLYNDIINMYSQPRTPIDVTHHLKHLDDEHAKEKYRLLWEFLFIAPPITGVKIYKG